ncbi:MAG TPA: lipopolysaccharide kinase InaA family protein [Candidatus Binataceae bacterium]|nr:lipopolysaccharide kinase InaA family protein [Candidatus Binataceae bacterium]
MRKRVLFAADPRWAAMAERLDVLMADGGFRALKDEARTRAGLLKGPDDAWVFVKRVRTGSWARGLIATARGSRVRRWLDGAAMLSRAGFNRPTPLAAVEVCHAGAVSECYLVCEALSDAKVLSGAVLDGGRVHFRPRRALLSTVVREVRRLHDAGLYTLDLQETNLMVQERADAPPRISFVDLEDFRRVRSVSWHRRLLNLVHLDRSIGRFLNRPARLRCLYDYLGPDKLERSDRRRIVQQFWQLRDGRESRHQARALRLALADASRPPVSLPPGAEPGAAGRFAVPPHGH